MTKTNLSDFSVKNTLNCRGKLLDLSTPAVMGILNITPDSFYDGGRNHSLDKALEKAEQMLRDGALIIDVGGYSSRPGAADVPVQEELSRVIPVIEALKKHLPEILISVDSFRAEVAEQAIAAGACMINDISGGDDDPAMFPLLGRLQVPYILMHKLGSIAEMQKKPVYNNVVNDIIHTLHPKVQWLHAHGVHDVIIDPGFGFGKTIAHNFEILSRLDEFRIFGLPVLAGLSRKSSIYKTLGITAEEALNGTTVCHSIALLKGASLLRVHDVKEAVQCIQLMQHIHV